MPDCEVLIGKCADVKTEIADDAAELACGEVNSSLMAQYITAAAFIKLCCIMNSIALKVYPLGDICPPEERADHSTEYWMGSMPTRFQICDVMSSKNSLEGSTLSVEGSGGSSSESCEFEKWNIRITPATGDPILMFADFVEQDSLCGKAVLSFGADFSEDFLDINKIIPECSRLDVITGDCVIGTGLRLDLIGAYPLC